MAADKKTLQRDALKFVQGGKIDKAIDAYRAIVKLDPKDAAVRNALADLFIRQGKKKEGIAEYLEAAALYEREGFYPRASAVCQKVVKLDPEQWSVRLKLADLYAAQKLPAEARALYAQLADRHEKRGEVNAALEIFRKIADLDPENLPVRVRLGSTFEKQKQPDKAAAEYVRAAKAYTARGDKDSAAKLLVRAFKLSPANLEARRLLADFYAQRQDWQVVVGLLETPVARGAQDTSLVVLYGEALTRVNHAREAATLLEKLREREPNDVPVNLALGRAFLKAGEIAKGAEALNRCVDKHLSDNQPEQAEALLQELAAAAPDDDRVLQRIAELARKRGDAGGAAAAQLKLAALYEKKGLARNAVGVLEQFLEARPGDAAATAQLGRLRAALTAEEPAPAPPSAAAVKPPAAAAPAPAAKPPVAAPPPSPPPRAAAASLDEEVEIDLDLGEEELAQVADEEGELVVVADEEEVPEFVAEPASVAEARECVLRGAPEQAAAFLEDHLGTNPQDVAAWEALVEARRALGSPKAARDALLRLADVHRRSRRIEEARAAYKEALDLDHRCAAAVRGMAELFVEEEAHAAAAEPEVATPAEAAAPEPPPAEPPAAAPEALAPAEDLIEVSLDEEPAPPRADTVASDAAFGEVTLPVEPGPVVSPPAEAAYGEISLDELAAGETAAAAPAPAAVPEPEGYGEISLDAEPLPGATPPAEEAGGFGEISLDEASPDEAAVDAVAVDELTLDEESLDAVAVDEVTLDEESADEVLIDEASLDEVSIDEEDTVPAPAPASPDLPEEVPPEGVLQAEAEAAEPPLPAVQQQGEPAPEMVPEPVPEPAMEAVSGQLPEMPEGSAEPPAAVDIPPDLQATLAEAEFYLQQGLLAEAEALAAKLEALAPGHPAVVAQVRQIREQRAAEPSLEPHPAWDLPGLEEVAPAASAPGSGADFADFLGDLRQELEATGGPAPPPPLEEAGLTEIFQEFQRSVREQLGDEDFETHYNLGIAYKEMGLVEEALGEFTLAEKSPTRSMDAVSMIALCLREQGRVDEAVQKLRTGIGLAVEGSEQQKGFLYDLAALHEQSGRADLAREALERLHALDPAYRDVTARLGPGATPAPGGARKRPKVSYL